MKSGCLELHVIIRDDLQVRDSLALTAPVRQGAVMAMLSLSEDFRCDPGRHCVNVS
jgi:hypothetical protein